MEIVNIVAGSSRSVTYAAGLWCTLAPEQKRREPWNVSSQKACRQFFFFFWQLAEFIRILCS